MVRQQSQAFRPELNGIRIAGTSAAIALHVCVLMVLLTPTQWSPPPVVVDEPPRNVIEVKIPIPKPIPLPVPAPVHKQKATTSTTSTRQDSTTTDTPVVRDEPSDIVFDANAATHDESFSNPLPPTIAELTADLAPTPPYPPIAVREGTTGLVMLRIGVDATGHPFEGRIEKTSGSRLLDQAALKFVLAHWHFNPAMRGGAAVAAIALVPIEFSLDR